MMQKEIEIIVDSRCRVKVADLNSQIYLKLIDRFTYRDPVYASKLRNGFSILGLSKYMKTFTENNGVLSFFRGTVKSIIGLIVSSGGRAVIKDNRLLFKDKCNFKNNIIPRDYQLPAIEKFIKHQQGLGRGAAGLGKTELLLCVAAHFKQPTLVLVWMERQQNVWLERIKQWFGIEAGGIGGKFKFPVITDFTVALVQSVGNRLRDIRNRFGCVICDEVDRFAAPTLSRVVNNLPAAIRLGVSDDERRRDDRQFLLYDTFGSLLWDLGRTTGQCPVNVYLVESPIKEDEIAAETSVELISKLTEHESRNNLIVRLVSIELSRGSQILIWSDRVEHCKHLQFLLEKKGVSSVVLLGGPQNRKATSKGEELLQSKKISVGIGTSITEKSINIPSLNVGIMTCASAGRKPYRFRQMRGRIARTCAGKEGARLYYIIDDNIPSLNSKRRYIRRFKPKTLLLPMEDNMATKEAAVTLESLKLGCKMLGIPLPAKADMQKLENLIKLELQKQKTYGDYACGGCLRDIPLGLSTCPYCNSKFKHCPSIKDVTPPIDEEEIDAQDEAEEEIEADEDQQEDYAEDQEDEQEVEEETESDEQEEEEDVAEYSADDEMEDKREDEEQEAEMQEIEEETEEEEMIDPEEPEEEEVEEEVEEIPEPKAKPKKKIEPKKPLEKSKGLKMVPPSVLRERRQKQLEAERKREQIQSELPYSKMQLSKMKRNALVMVASVIGIKDPIAAVHPDDLIDAIIEQQRRKFGAPKQTIKPPIKPPIKPTIKPTIKAPTKSKESFSKSNSRPIIRSSKSK